MKKGERNTSDEGGRYLTVPPTIYSPGCAVRGLERVSLRDSEFIRLPRPRERCPLTGLSRTTMVELSDAGKIRAVKLRKPGRMRGIVLIDKASLLNYLRSLEPECEGEVSDERR